MHSFRNLCLFGILAPLGLVACSGSGDGRSDDDAPPPPPPPTTRFLLDASDPCAAKVPTPTDLFINDDGTSERAGCPLPTDPLEAARADAFRNVGAPTDAEIRIPVEGSLDALTLSSTVTFSMTGDATGGPPPVVVLEQTGTSTDAAGWAVVGADVRFVDQSIVIKPRRALAQGRNHVVVTTRVIRSAESPPGRVVVTPAVGLLVGETAIAADAIEGLDAATAARLERERLRLEPIVDLLQEASPPIPRDQIASIQAFSTDPGYGRFERLVELYFAALDEGTYTNEATHASVDKTSVFIGVPPANYQNVNEVHVGTMKAPRLLDENGRLRPNWHLVKEEIEIPFAISLPVGSDRYPVILFVPGFGRGKIDVRSLAQEYAEGADAAVMVIDLRCHGDRSPDEGGVCGENRSSAEVDALQDVQPNNGNMELNGADGIPDDSGRGFLPGDGVALRDSQMAAAIEIMHVLHGLRTPANFMGLNPNAGNLHLVAQGHTAPAAALAIAETQDPTARITLVLPSGGADYRELILNGPADLKGSWISSLPHGLTEAQSADYFTFVEETLLPALDLTKAAESLKTRLVNGTRYERILLPHGAVPGFVPMAARSALIDELDIMNNRVSGHRAPCDDFFLFVCMLGQNPTYMAEARRQMVTFMNSGGVTVIAPGQ